MKRTIVFAVALALAFSALAQPRRTVARGLPQPLRDATIDNAASCDIGTSPAATLLLPYFEVEIDKHVNEAKNTIFSLINTSLAVAAPPLDQDTAVEGVRDALLEALRVRLTAPRHAPATEGL